MCDVQKGGVSLYETARQEVVVEGLDLEGSLVEDCEDNIFFVCEPAYFENSVSDIGTCDLKL